MPRGPIHCFCLFREVRSLEKLFLMSSALLHQLNSACVNNRGGCTSPVGILLQPMPRQLCRGLNDAMFTATSAPALWLQTSILFLNTLQALTDLCPMDHSRLYQPSPGRSSGTMGPAKSLLSSRVLGGFEGTESFRVETSDTTMHVKKEKI